MQFNAKRRVFCVRFSHFVRITYFFSVIQSFVGTSFFSNEKIFYTSRELQKRDSFAHFKMSIQ